MNGLCFQPQRGTPLNLNSEADHGAFAFCFLYQETHEPGVTHCVDVAAAALNSAHHIAAPSSVADKK